MFGFISHGADSIKCDVLNNLRILNITFTAELIKWFTKGTFVKLLLNSKLGWFGAKILFRTWYLSPINLENFTFAISEAPPLFMRLIFHLEGIIYVVKGHLTTSRYYLFEPSIFSKTYWRETISESIWRLKISADKTF